MIPAIANFRSLEGIATTDGRRVKPGVLYRSEALVDLTLEARDALASLRISTVCDLRSPPERARHPLDWPGTQPRFLEMETLPDVRVAGADLIHDILADTTGKVARQTLLSNSRAMPTAFARSMRRVFDTVVDQQGLPLLVSCVAGKDRTGYVISVILLALGASSGDIVAEFMRSAEYIDTGRLRAEMVEWLAEPLDEMVSVETLHSVGVLPEYVDAAFGTIVAEYGSYEAFLGEACGLNQPRLDKLRDLMLE
jgi:protein-tyrosine phosphatase